MVHVNLMYMLMRRPNWHLLVVKWHVSWLEMSADAVAAAADTVWYPYYLLTKGFRALTSYVQDLWW